MMFGRLQHRHRLLATALAVAASGCFFGAEPPPLRETPPADSGTGPASDLGPETYSNLTDTTKWSTFDTSNISGANDRGFRGAAFDGRYSYFVPSYNGVARYDTRASFADASSWSSFDATTVNTGSRGFWGATFDGQYVYLVPFGYVVTRYDTQSSFSAGSLSSTFDTASLNVQPIGFIGAAFDGRYVYLAPYHSGTVARYDTQATFTAAAA
jgi:hypothetical protein